MRRLLIWLFCAAGCSNGSPLDPATVLNTMSDQEARDVCEYRADKYREARGSLRDRCTVVAVREDTSADCEAQLQACLDGGDLALEMAQGATAQAMEQLVREFLDCSDATAASWSDCVASFGEYRDCLNAQTAEYVKYRDSLSCEHPANISGPFLYLPTQPAGRSRLKECEAFYDRCPPG